MNGWFRRILLIAVRSDEGPLTEHITATQVQPPGLVFMPHSRPLPALRKQTLSCPKLVGLQIARNRCFRRDRSAIIRGLARPTCIRVVYLGAEHGLGLLVPHQPVCRYGDRYLRGPEPHQELD
jgi:hypothetical protein